MSKPNVIFCDCDGVLCNPRACIAVGDTKNIYSYLDPIACLLVKKLCEETNSKLVISSSWRKYHNSRKEFSSILNAACPQLGHFIWDDPIDWRTPDHNGCTGDKFGRGREIASWVKTNNGCFNNFVILDDDSDMEPYMERLVKCDSYDGIGFMNYKDAKKLLQEND
jgi:hypothetical protein